MKSSRWKKIVATLLLFAMCMGTLGGEVQAARTDLTHGIWHKHGRHVTVTTPAGTRTYTIYNQLKCKGGDPHYYQRYGCVTAGVSIAASGFGVVAKPWTIRGGSASKACSERRALKQLKQSRKNYAISIRLASRILSNIGIPNKAVTSFNDAEAEAEIRQHLQAGKPVIVKVGKRQYDGVKFTKHHHTLVLIGMVDDYVVFINPVNGKINGSRVGKHKSKINLTLHTLVTKFMYSSKKGTHSAYVKRDKSGGGYILVG